MICPREPARAVHDGGRGVKISEKCGHVLYGCPLIQGDPKQNVIFEIATTQHMELREKLSIFLKRFLLQKSCDFDLKVSFARKDRICIFSGKI